MMRKIATITVFIVLCSFAYAQELSVKDFHVDPSDISAVRYEVEDLNGNACALLKVGLVIQDVTFEGSIVKSEFKDGEWWVYMVDKAWWLNIKTKKYLPLRYEFPEPLQKKSTYILQIEAPQVAYTGPTGKMRIEANVRDADVYIDGEKLSSILPFEYEGPEGAHVAELRAPGYNVERMNFNIELQRKGTLKMTMKAEGSFSHEGISYEMVNVSGGQFEMGLKGSTIMATPHTVRLTGYRIGKTEVTQNLWTAIMGSNPSLHQGENLPVENVSWWDVMEFIEKLNATTGEHFRLPTEAEWEYAARSNGKTAGDSPAGTAVNGSQTLPPGSKGANSLGLVDMSGNVAEWCSDWFAPYEGAATNPSGPDSGVQKIVRGGYCSGEDWLMNSAFRDSKRPSDFNGNIGFRLAADE